MFRNGNLEIIFTNSHMKQIKKVRFLNGRYTDPHCISIFLQVLVMSDWYSAVEDLIQVE